MGDLHDRFSIDDAQSMGDGTVPHESGLAPGTRGGAIEQWSLAGFDHQSAYLPEMSNVMSVTKYAIAKIAQKADWGMHEGGPHFRNMPCHHCACNANGMQSSTG